MREAHSTLAPIMSDAQDTQVANESRGAILRLEGSSRQ